MSVAERIQLKVHVPSFQSGGLKLTALMYVRMQVEIIAPADKKSILHSKKNGDGISQLRTLPIQLKRLLIAHCLQRLPFPARLLSLPLFVSLTFVFACYRLSTREAPKDYFPFSLFGSLLSRYRLCRLRFEAPEDYGWYQGVSLEKDARDSTCRQRCMNASKTKG